MKDEAIVFLQWALPRLQLRWPGYRRVWKQVDKRIRRRMDALGVCGYAEYRSWLIEHPAEWAILDGLCRITISRFFRGRGVFNALCDTWLPALAARASQESRPLRVWSAGCASGEEPYSVALICALEYRGLTCEIVATDADAHLLERARRACYPASSLRELPAAGIEKFFFRQGEEWCLHRTLVERVCFLQQDIRREQPDGPFDLILCRYLVATYFAPALQEEVFSRLASRLPAGGILVLGSHESLPDGIAWEDMGKGIYRRIRNTKYRMMKE